MHTFSWLLCSTGVLESAHASQFSIVDRCLSVILRAYQLLSPSSEFKSVSLLGLVAIELTHRLFVSLPKVNCHQSKQEPALLHTHTRCLNRWICHLCFTFSFFSASVTLSLYRWISVCPILTVPRGKERLLASRVFDRTVIVEIEDLLAPKLQLSLVFCVNTRWRLFAIVILLSHNNSFFLDLMWRSPLWSLLPRRMSRSHTALSPATTTFLRRNKIC